MGGNYEPMDPRDEERRARMRNEGLWRDEDAELYNEGESISRCIDATQDVAGDSEGTGVLPIVDYSELPGRIGWTHLNWDLMLISRSSTKSTAPPLAHEFRGHRRRLSPRPQRYRQQRYRRPLGTRQGRTRPYHRRAHRRERLFGQPRRKQRERLCLPSERSHRRRRTRVGQRLWKPE